METELKYGIPSREKADAIWEEAFVSPYSDNSTAEKVVMKAVYFDTEDRILSKNNVAVSNVAHKLPFYFFLHSCYLQRYAFNFYITHTNPIYRKSISTCPCIFSFDEFEIV